METENVTKTRNGVAIRHERHSLTITHCGLEIIASQLLCEESDEFVIALFGNKTLSFQREYIKPEVPEEFISKDPDDPPADVQAAISFSKGFFITKDFYDGGPYMGIWNSQKDILFAIEDETNYDRIDAFIKAIKLFLQ